MTGEVAVRTAGADDVEAITRLVRAAYADYVPQIGREPAPMTEDHARVVAAGNTWVAVHGAEIVGVLVLRPATDHLLVENVAVAPAMHGRGVGARLLAFAEQEANRLGLTELRLYTNEVMTANLRYYPRHGYRETHRDIESGFSRVYFTKTIS